MGVPNPTCQANPTKNAERFKKYQEQFGRPLRIAHVGNIANNAYLAARDQRRLGVEAYAFSPDYVHVMGFPEWEECDFERDTNRGHFDPEFPEVSFVRPHWFHSGSWDDIAKSFRFENGESVLEEKPKFSLRFFLTGLAFDTWRLVRPVAKKLTPLRLRAWVVNSLLIFLRKPGAQPAELVLNRFDIVHFYGPYNFVTALINLRPNFVSTEHGTIRDYIFSDYAQAKMSKVGYQQSSAVLVTNQDSFPQTDQLGISGDRVFFTPHPINEDDFPTLRALRDQLTIPRPHVVVPARQVKRSTIDAGKGNDIVLAAIRTCIDRGLDIKFLIPLWGDHVAESRKLARSLGVESAIEWLPLLSRPRLKHYMATSLAVIDQFNVAAYGAVGADAIGIGTPLISRQDCGNDNLAFGSCAPILNALSSEDVVVHLERLLAEPMFHTNYATASRAWFDSHLTMGIATARALDAYDLAFTVGKP